MKDRIFAIGWPFSPAYSSNSTRRPKHFRWTKDPSEATIPITVCIDGGIRKGLKQPGRKIAWILESPAISAWQKVSLFIKQNLDEVLEAYEVVLTSDRDFCRLDPKIQYHTAGSNLPWIAEEQYGLHEKTKLCSMFASNKQMVEGHRIRHTYAERLKDKLDLFGGACGSKRLGNGKPHPHKAGGLIPYMFSVTMENCRVPLYYTEKITDCFATGTVPVYWGPREIGEIFDSDGILFLDEDFDPGMLSEDLYRSMLPAVRQNLEIVSDLEGSDDELYRKYIRA